MKKKIILNANEYDVDILSKDQEKVIFEWEGKKWNFSLNGDHLKDDKENSLKVLSSGEDFWLNGRAYKIESSQDKKRERSKSQAAGGLASPMPGKIFKILVEEGQNVEKDRPLIVMEAMKMEHTLRAPFAGIVRKLPYKEGEQVVGGVELVVLEEVKED